ncbi:hypothetical protein BOTBODRAFT_136319 [Botryobasidium botryosum FD-172 SS1]|uniref:Dienelactone hydrolase domain-containing protein n=1 Tax=Botryobasidium botryosum (strain FD-172 SS1) TaxID=930990 RepID=A0A067M5H6_BOTB1|nr:hypothetical protein BOTBODRAFT_136319 [Botryobasidium botryosum FD-172 SS1]
MSQPGLSSCCASGYLHEGTPTGAVEKIANLNVYVSKPSSGSKAKSVLFISDIFGWDYPNARLLADEYAKAGFYVYVPDILDNDPVDSKYLSTICPKPEEQENPALNEGKPTINLGAWAANHGDDVTRPRVDAIVSALRADPEIKKLGAVGFCYGARYAILIGSGNNSAIDAIVANHPSMLAIPGDYANVSKPILINNGDKDNFLSLSEVDKVKAELEKNKNLVSKIVIYPGASHGFTVRGDITNEHEKATRDAAATETIAWFNQHLA